MLTVDATHTRHRPRSSLNSTVGTPVQRDSSKPIRIAYCIDTMHIGGTELNALRTAERLDRSRFHVTVISLQPDGPLARRYEEAGIPVLGFPFSSLYSPDALRQGWRLVRWLRQERIQIVHCHDLYANLFGVPWSRLAGVRTVIASRRWIHPSRNRLLDRANRFAYRLADWVLVNSTAVAEAVASVDGVSRRRILKVPNFVDENAFVAMSAGEIRRRRSELGVSDDAQVVGCIARLSPIKDHVTLLAAVSILRDRFPRLRLMLIGDGECRTALESATRDMGIRDRVHFAGTMPNEPNLHHLFDISVLVSVSEGFPNTLVEAMAAGKPAVATSVGGNVDAVRPETGLLVPPGAPTELARALAQLLDDTALRNTMAAAAAHVARREYHAGSVIPALERLYSRFASGVRMRQHDGDLVGSTDC